MDGTVTTAIESLMSGLIERMNKVLRTIPVDDAELERLNKQYESAKNDIRMIKNEVYQQLRRA